MSAHALLNKVEQTQVARNRPWADDIRTMLTRGRQLEGATETTAFIESALVLCKQYYEAGRSLEVLPLTRTAYALAVKQHDPLLKRRAATAHGILLAENGNYGGAFEYHAQALKLAKQSGDKPELARVWANIGGVFFYSAAYEIALDAYLRAREVLRGQPKHAFPRHLLHSNLAQCYFHLSDTRAGLHATRRALALETPEIVKRDPLNAIYLRRNCVRLLVRAKKIAEALPLVEEAERLSLIAASPRTDIAAMVTRGMYEIATGKSDAGLMRMEQALEQARRYPITLRDTLTSMMQAEEMAGNLGRAAFYLHELADTLYRETIEQARKHLELSQFYDSFIDEKLEEIETTRREMYRKGRSPRSIADWETFEQLATTASFKIDSNGLHHLRVGELTARLASESGCDPQLAGEIGYAARFHDIGMLTVPDSILNKSGPLSTHERAMRQAHCRAGVEILSGSTHASTMMAIEIARYHHEWWNGQGYPHGIAGNAIPKPARLCAVADAFDALISPRKGHNRFTIDEAGEKLLTLAGTQLDPQLVECFVKSLRGEGEDSIRYYLTGNEQPSQVPGLDDLVASLSHDLNS